MPRRIYKNLSVQVLTAIAVGAAIGHFFPKVGVALGPVGQAFIGLVKMIVAPIVFLTIVNGIAKMSDLKQAGRVGLKAIAYFLSVTTLALAIGMAVANAVRPGSNIHPTTTSAQDKADVDKYTDQAKKQSLVDLVLHAIPNTFVSAFTEGEMLQVLLVAILFGVAVAGMGTKAAGLLHGLEGLADVMFRIVTMLMRLAPLGAFGAMALTIGKYGLSSLTSLATLMLCVYLTMAAFIFIVLWAICLLAHVSLFRYLAYIKEEILLVLGTSSSEAALPRMIEKLEKLGCAKSVVGMVIPAGYSFNLDGTAIYLSMAALFIAQAMGVHLTFGEQAYMLGVLIVTSKGAAAVTGGGFITLAATLGTVHHELVPGLALILGVDRFMSEARAITNLIGNGVATMVVSKWEGAFDQEQYERATNSPAAAAPV